MNDYSMVGSASYSLAKECKRLYDDGVRVNGVKEHRKHNKREDTQKLRKRFYHLQNKDKVVMVGIKKKTLGFRKGNRNRLSSIYKIIYDYELGICNADVRRISCAYSFCVEQLD